MLPAPDGSLQDPAQHLYQLKQGLGWGFFGGCREGTSFPAVPSRQGEDQRDPVGLALGRKMLRRQDRRVVTARGLVYTAFSWALAHPGNSRCTVNCVAQPVGVRNPHAGTGAPGAEGASLPLLSGAEPCSRGAGGSTACQKSTHQTQSSWHCPDTAARSEGRLLPSPSPLPTPPFSFSPLLEEGDVVSTP